MSITCADLADQLVALVTRQLGQAAASFCSGFVLPNTYCGHSVGSEARADLAFTLSMLGQNGVEAVAGSAVPAAIGRVLEGMDAGSACTCHAYRLAEALVPYGTFDQNSIVATLDKRARANLAAACGPTGSVDHLLRQQPSRSFPAVLARYEQARRQLGLPHDPGLLEQLLILTRARLAERPGRLDDSHTGIGRYDLCTADTYLLCQPFAEGLGPIWNEGFRELLKLIRSTATLDGSAMAWGPSAGVLGVCHTIQLAALALRTQLTDCLQVWRALLANALKGLDGWFSNGVIVAHQHRTANWSRGSAGRLQLTFEVLGKLTDAARHLRHAQDVGIASWAQTFAECDELIWFDEQKRAGVWVYRNDRIAFSLPVSGDTSSDYLPWPRSPGLFEAPGEKQLCVGVPFVVAHGIRYVGAGLPRALRKEGGQLTLSYSGWPEVGQTELDLKRPPLHGTRECTLKVEGDTIAVTEKLSFGEPPSAVALQVAETQRSPLHVGFEAPDGAMVCKVDTTGIAEWRSSWGELPLVAQIDLKPQRSISFSWRVRPLLRVLTPELAYEHHYHRGIYDVLQEAVRDAPARSGVADGMTFDLGNWDLFHQHWPEWHLGRRVEAHVRLIERLEQAGVRIVWTMHNLVPHRIGEWSEIYRVWAAAAHGVIHHSQWGRDRALDQYGFRAGAVHAVIPHPHFGHLIQTDPSTSIATQQRQPPEPRPIRLAVIGAPRRAKRTHLVAEAVMASARQDIELLLPCLADDEPVPQDRRIRASRYQFVPREQYDALLASVDAVILPFDADGMMTTGTVGDVVAHGLPALTSDWPFLSEVLGEAAIPFGSTAEQLRACIDELDSKRLERAAAASRALRGRYDREVVARETLAFFKRLLRHEARDRMLPPARPW